MSVMGTGLISNQSYIPTDRKVYTQMKLINESRPVYWLNLHHGNFILEQTRPKFTSIEQVLLGQNCQAQCLLLIENMVTSELV